MDKEKAGSQGGTPRTSLFACFPVSRRNFCLQFLSSVILAPHIGANSSDTWHRGKTHHSANKSFLPHSGMFSKIPPHAGRHSFQEPTSPEVTCFGQVRVKETQHKALDAAIALNRSVDIRQPKLPSTISEARRRSPSLRRPKESSRSQLLGSKGSVMSPQTFSTDAGALEIYNQRFSKMKLSPSRSMNSTFGKAFEKSLQQRQNENDQEPENLKEEEKEKDTLPYDSLS